MTGVYRRGIEGMTTPGRVETQRAWWEREGIVVDWEAATRGGMRRGDGDEVGRLFPGASVDGRHDGAVHEGGKSRHQTRPGRGPQRVEGERRGRGGKQDEGRVASSVRKRNQVFRRAQGVLLGS